MTRSPRRHAHGLMTRLAARDHPGAMGRILRVLAALGSGILIAAALPPWGWWPLAFVGLVALDRLVADRPRRARFARALTAGIGIYVPSLLWMQDMTLPGYLVAALAYAALWGLAFTVVPASAPARWWALPGAIALTELVRWSWPFGGVPLSNLAIGQVAGPLAPVLRLGGALLLVEVTVIAAVVLAALLHHRWRAAVVGAAVVIAALTVAAVVPRAEQVDTLDVALVQGGGEQGTRARSSDQRALFLRHLETSQQVTPPVDLVVWPEDVVDVEGPVTETWQGTEVARHARELGVPVVVGVVEGVDREHFRNASVVYGPDGEIIGRYDKVHRVPFGEYVPLRSQLGSLAAAASPRDAIVGDQPALLETPAGDLAVAISWEIFFGDRVREGVGGGAGIVINPTNGSSFTGTLVQTQQVATSRMRAIENDRWVVQVAPTGLSAVIAPDGTVIQRSGVSEQVVLQATVGLRQGTTPYTRLGLAPAWIVAVAALGIGAAAAARDRRRAGTSSGAQTSSSSVTGPSLTSSTAMSAPNRPVATEAPSDRSSSTTRSTSGSA